MLVGPGRQCVAFGHCNRPAPDSRIAPFPRRPSRLDETRCNTRPRHARRPDARLEHEAPRPSRAAGLRRHGRRAWRMQATRDGRRILWLAHESAPKNFTGVDVTDPRAPKVVVQTDLPHAKMRSNSLDVVGDMMAVAYQTSAVNIQPAGFDLFDISTPETPKLISHFDASGPHSRGVHAVWFVDGEFVHMASGAADFQPRNPKDDQFYRIVDVRNPVEAGRGRPLVVARHARRRRRAAARAAAAAVRHRLPRAQHQRVSRARPTAPTSATSTAARSSSTSPTSRARSSSSHWRYSPPFNGFTHTVLPLFERELLIVSDECVQDDGEDWPKLVLGGRRARRDQPRADRARFPPPPLRRRSPSAAAASARTTCTRTCRCRRRGARTTIVIGTFFNAGVRAYDVSNPYQPQEVAYFVPGAPKLSPRGRDPAERRVRRRPRRIVLHRRPLRRRPVRPRDDALILEPAADARPPGRQAAGHRDHRLPRQRQDDADQVACSRHPGMNRAAVIVNEFGEVGIDHELVAASSENVDPALQRLPLLRRAHRPAGDAARRSSRSAGRAK